MGFPVQDIAHVVSAAKADLMAYEQPLFTAEEDV